MSGVIWVLMVATGLTGMTGAETQRSSDYGASLRAARRARRPLLVMFDIKARQRRHIVPGLAREVDDVRDELLTPYQLCEVDVTTDYGRKVADAFRATDFPHLAIIDKTGSVILYERSGGMSTKEWETALVAHRSGERKHQPVVVDDSSVVNEPIRTSLRSSNCFT